MLHSVEQGDPLQETPEGAKYAELLASLESLKTVMRKGAQQYGVYFINNFLRFACCCVELYSLLKTILFATQK